jgi:hypothetical protein
MPHAEASVRASIQEIRRWRRTLGRHVWLLRRAGVAAEEIEREVTKSLHQCRGLPKLNATPAPDERVIPRILSHWWHESEYLDSRGQPRALRLDGPMPTFRSLVRAAAPGASVKQVLGGLRRRGLVSCRSNGKVRLVSDASYACRVQQGDLLNTTLALLGALSDTGYANLQASRPGQPLRLQRSAYTEYLDRRYLQAYKEFLEETAQVFLAMHDSWLKHHEIKDVPRPRWPSARVGVGMFAIRGD